MTIVYLQKGFVITISQFAVLVVLLRLASYVGGSLLGYQTTWHEIFPRRAATHTGPFICSKIVCGMEQIWASPLMGVDLLAAGPCHASGERYSSFDTEVEFMGSAQSCVGLKVQIASKSVKKS